MLTYETLSCDNKNYIITMPSDSEQKTPHKDCVRDLCDTMSKQIRGRAFYGC